METIAGDDVTMYLLSAIIASIEYPVAYRNHSLVDDCAWSYSKIDVVSKTLGKCSKRMTKSHEFKNMVREARVARPHTTKQR